METTFHQSPNKLLPVHKDYNFKDSNCGFGNLAKTNIFIGENNSGKSRFLRYLFQSDFYAISNEQFAKFFSETKDGIYNSYEPAPKSNIH